LKIPEGAIPADQAAIYMLDRAAEQKGIIIVPEEPHTSLWRRYVNGDPDMEVFALQMAHDRRVAYETRGTFY
ncbi:MAG TPA: SDR family NAD(P)-dependent oxidoreductase, partial [Methanoregulaceae archaeon]|nr:SDR family NAD(P)-dependent oxidoreductase [Methanoregulaceae archaeon]